MTSITERLRRSVPNWSSHLVLVSAIAFFCVPLFIGLDRWDLRNDESIYSYSVDRILETGEWLTPRAIPYDDNFLEKPPLKFWIVAAAIRSGLLPHNEFGLRFLDPLLGAIAFVYVFVLGRRLAGPLCGFVALLVLFTIEGLLFEHGIRGNQMEAPLLLAYCGGVYHFARWVEGDSSRRPWLHALLVGIYFSLGFMTKFVAVLFLPLVCVMALAWRRDPFARVRSGWRDWIVPILVSLAIIAPWFIYQAFRDGAGLWRVMFGEHVVTRFTATLDPRHQQPWHHYYSYLWSDLTTVGSQWIAGVGVSMLAINAWRGRPWLARLLFLWWAVPFALMSTGTSKVFHYAIPFLPPVALGAGLVAVPIVHMLERLLVRAGKAAVIAIRARMPRLGSIRMSRNARYVLLAGAAFCVGLALWTFMAGRIVWKIGGIQLLKNTSTFRPLVIAAILLGLGGHTRALSRGLALAAVALVLPITGYDHVLFRARLADHPLRALRDCAITVGQSRAPIQMYPLYGELDNHANYYYLRRVGPWIAHDRHPTHGELQRQLFVPGEQSLVIMLRRDWDTFKQEVARGAMGAVRLPVSVELQNDIVLLTPGPFDSCGRAALAATHRPIVEIPRTEAGQ